MKIEKLFLLTLVDDKIYRSIEQSNLLEFVLLRIYTQTMWNINYNTPLECVNTQAVNALDLHENMEVVEEVVS